MKLKLALVQMNCAKGDIRANLSKTQEYIQEAINEGSHFICFPEMSITGYIDPSKMSEAVITLDHEAVKEFIGMTAGQEIIVLAGMAEMNPIGKPFITQLVAHQGRLDGVYRKTNIAEDEKDKFAPGVTISAFHLQNVTFGITICADIDKEEIFAEYAKQGAKLVFEAASPGLYGEQETRDWKKGFNWWKGNCEKKIGSYARNLKLYIAVSTHAGRTIDEDFPGGGYIYDPSGQRIKESDDWSEGILYGEIDI